MNCPHDLAYCYYRLPLKQPLTTGGGLERSGMLISLDGAVGEASPLPGLHQENLDELPAWLERFEGPARLDDSDCRALLRRVNDLPGFSAFPPSLRFGIESAYVAGAAARLNLPLKAYLWPGVARTTSSVALFSGSSAEAEALLGEGAFENYCGVKIKVGRGSLEDDLRTIGLFRAKWPEAEIRLDANRSMDVAQVIAMARQIEALAVRFIEEPFAHADQLAEYLAMNHNLPVALDESLIEAVAAGRLPARGKNIKAWVIKPSCLGILESCRLIDEAGSVESIISSSFESNIGLEMLTALAGGSKAGPGLGTDRWFAGNLRPEHLSDWIPLQAGSDG